MHTVEFLMLDQNAQPAFVMVFFDVDPSEFMRVPGGSDRIKASLRRRGLEGFTTSPFLMRVR